MNDKNRKKVANLVKGLAELSARNAVNKKLIMVLYEPEVPEAVKKFASKTTK